MKYLPRMGSVYIGVLLACITGSPGLAARSRDVELRAVVNAQCVVADEPYFIPEEEGTPKAIGLVGIVVGKVAQVMVEHAFKAAARMWRTRGQDSWYTLLPPTDLYVAKLDPAPVLALNENVGCLTVVAGTFQPDDADCRAQYVPRTIAPEVLQQPESEWHTSRTLDSAQNQLRRANICTDGEPRAVMEARLQLSADATAYRLTDAGYRVNSLLDTKDAKAERYVFYTLEISEPGSAGGAALLSTAWLEMGTVGPGKRTGGLDTAADPGTPWLRVPPLSVEARRVYEERTHVHQDTQAQIEALERAIVREQRVVATLDERAASARKDMVAGLQDQARVGRVRIETLQAELDARRAEYAELPHETLRLMPVVMKVGVTESKSAKRGQELLAKLVDQNAAVVSPAATALVPKSLGAPASTAGRLPAPGSAAAGAAVPAASGGEAELRAARAAYFDALVNAKFSADAAAIDVSKAKARYDAARRAAGLEVIQ